MNTMFLSPEARTVAVMNLAEDGTLPDHISAAYANELVGGTPVSTRPATDASTATVSYTVAEAAEILGVAQSTIRRRIKKGDYAMSVKDDVQRVTIPA